MGNSPDPIKSQNNEERIKKQYRQQVEELKAQVQQMAAEHHMLSHALHTANLEIDALKKQIAELRQKQIVSIK